VARAVIALLKAAGPHDGIKALAGKEAAGGRLVGERDRPGRQRLPDLSCDLGLGIGRLGAVG